MEIKNWKLKTIIVAVIFLLSLPTISEATTINKPSNFLALNTGLVGWWTFDGPKMLTNVADSSGQGNNGYLQGQTSTTTVPGKLGQALSFDGSNDYVDRGTGPTSVNTIAFWVYPKTTTEYFINLTSTTDYIWLNAGTVTATGLVDPTIYVNGVVSSTLSANQWQHVVVTTGTAENASNFDIGRTQDANYLEGNIDDVRIYNRVLSAGEVKQLYNIGAAKVAITSKGIPAQGLNSGLVGHWTFDGKDMLNGKALDRSGNNNTGTLVNIATSTFYKAGKIGQGFNFDGVNDWVNLGQSITAFDFSTTTGPYGANGNRFTIAVWVYPSGGTAIQVVHLRGRAEYSSAEYVIYALYKSSATVWSARISDGTNLITLSSASGQLVQNTWQFLTLVWDGTTLRLYKNGVSIGSGTNALFNGIWNHTLDSHRSTVIGAQKNDNRSYWSGKIDDFRAYNRALSAGEIQQLYNLGR